MVFLESKYQTAGPLNGCVFSLLNYFLILDVMMNGTKRADIRPGARVQVVQKQDQRSGKLTEGVVKDILTKSASHPHGIKVRLENGIVGRVKEILG